MLVSFLVLPCYDYQCITTLECRQKLLIRNETTIISRATKLIVIWPPFIQPGTSWLLNPKETHSRQPFKPRRNFLQSRMRDLKREWSCWNLLKLSPPSLAYKLPDGTRTRPLSSGLKDAVDTPGDLSAVSVILVILLLLPVDLGTRVPFPHRLTVMPIYLREPLLH